ncbi:hypothetical protein [Pseudomonas phage vB_Pa-PAC2]
MTQTSIGHIITITQSKQPRGQANGNHRPNHPATTGRQQIHCHDWG